MNNQQIITDVGGRYKALDQAVKQGRLDLPTAVHHYAWLARKDLGPGHLAMANLNAAEPTKANDSDASIPFVISTYAEDRDGDVVVPMGCRLHNYINNPVVFFGHQDNPLPIAKSMNPNGGLTVFPEENRIWAVAYFDKADEDAMNIYGKVKRGFLSATSIAFVPISARRRDDIHKGHQHEGNPGGWIFDEIDTTEWSVVGVPSNPQATVLQKSLRAGLRDVVDSERRSTSPRLLKALEPYCAKSINESGGCWSGWCPAPVKKAVAKPQAKAVGCSCHGKAKQAPKKALGEIQVGDTVWVDAFDRGKVTFIANGKATIQFSDGTRDEYPLSRLDKGIKKTQLDMEHGTTAGEIDMTKSGGCLGCGGTGYIRSSPPICLTCGLEFKTMKQQRAVTAKYITVNGVRYKSMSESSGADGGYVVPSEQKSGPDVEYDQGYVAAWDGRARSTNPYRTDEEGRGPEMRADWDAGWVDGAKERLTGRKRAKQAVAKGFVVEERTSGGTYVQTGPVFTTREEAQRYADRKDFRKLEIEFRISETKSLRRKSCSFCRGTGSGCGQPGDCPTCAGRGVIKGLMDDLFGTGAGVKVGDKVGTPMGDGVVTWVKTSGILQAGMDDVKVKLADGSVQGFGGREITRKSLGRRKGFTDILPFLDYGMPEQWVLALMAAAGAASSLISKTPALIQAIKDAWDRGASPQQAAQEVSNNMKKLRIRKSSLRAGDKVVDDTGSEGVVISSEVRNGRVFVDVRLSSGQVVDYIQDQLRKKSHRKGLVPAPSGNCPSCQLPYSDAGQQAFKIISGAPQQVLGKTVCLDCKALIESYGQTLKGRYKSLDEEQTMGMDEPMTHTPHETAIADLYRRAKDEHAYITEQLGSITPFDPQTGDANKAHADLKEYSDQVGQRLESLKAMFGAHSEKDIDELTAEEKSEVGGEEWAEEEANEPQHMELDDEEQMGMVTSGDGIANTGEANLVDRGEVPPDATTMTEDDMVQKGDGIDTCLDCSSPLDDDSSCTNPQCPQYGKALAEDVQLEKDLNGDLDEDIVEATEGEDHATEEVLERYQEAGKGWRTRKASTSTIAKVLRAGGSVKRGLDGRRWLVVRSVKKASTTSFKITATYDGYRVIRVSDGSEVGKFKTRAEAQAVADRHQRMLETGKSLRRKDLAEQSPDQVQMDLDPAHAEAIKACGAMMKGLAVAHDMPEHHKSALDMHGDALAKALNEGGHEEALAKALKHLKSLSGAPDVPEHHKAAMGHHSKGIGKVLKAMGTEEPAPVEEAEGEEEQVAKADENDQVAKALMDSLRDSALMLERTSHRVGIKV